VLATTGADYNPFGYTSAYTDPTTGLIHDGARYYNPADGRFTQQDPANQGPNLYTYAADNPLNQSDPTGDFSTAVTAGLIVGGGIVAGLGLFALAGLGGLAFVLGGGAELTGLNVGFGVATIAGVASSITGAVSTITSFF
jgi:RHS repeat-associated protein